MYSNSNPQKRQGQDREYYCGVVGYMSTAGQNSDFMDFPQQF
jgi:anthranilate/para-aminobenzoate synthase component I